MVYGEIPATAALRCALTHADCLLQMADLISHAFLKQEEEPSPKFECQGIVRSFGSLDRALNRRASRRDLQDVVRS